MLTSCEFAVVSGDFCHFKLVLPSLLFLSKRKRRKEQQTHNLKLIIRKVILDCEKHNNWMLRVDLDQNIFNLNNAYLFLSDLTSSRIKSFVYYHLYLHFNFYPEIFQVVR